MSELSIREPAALRQAQEQEEAEAAFDFFREQDRQRYRELVENDAPEAETEALLGQIQNPDYGVRPVRGGWERYSLKPEPEPEPESESEEDIEAAIEVLQEMLGEAKKKPITKGQ